MLKIAASLDRLVWLDLEMTGLNPDSDKILEIAMIITDAQLSTLVVSEVIAIHQSDETLDGMDAWNKGTHGKTGLIDRVRASSVDETSAENSLLTFLKAHVEPKTSPMCGNSICQDRRFLARHMPKLEDFFHYRNLDVSTLKELARRWCPDVAQSFKKRSAHTALADIQESIDELAHYRTHLFKDF